MRSRKTNIPISLRNWAELSLRIAAGSPDHINAMDMSEGYGDSGNPIGDKSQFVMSLFEQLDNNKNRITPIDRSIIDRCVSLVYEEARETKTIPTLKTLRSMLLRQPKLKPDHWL